MGNWKENNPDIQDFIFIEDVGMAIDILESTDLVT